MTFAGLQDFTGKEREGVEGASLDYFGARYLSGAMGRFGSPDAGPYIWSDPQTMNRYSYTRSNPLKYVDPTGNYFVVSGDNTTARQLMSMLLRSDLGRDLVRSIASDPRPTFVDTGRLEYVRRGMSRFSFTKGLTTLLAGPGGLAGTNVTIDPVNCAIQAAVTGTNSTRLLLKAFAHELFHVQAANKEHVLWKAAGAAAGGDIPTFIGALLNGGAGGTESGTAELGALAVLLQMGETAESYNPDPAADSEAGAIIESGIKKERSRMFSIFGAAIGTHASPVEEDAARLCALGNPAACSR